MTETASAPLPSFPLPRSCPFDLSPTYAQLRDERPIAQVELVSGKVAWLITRHQDVRRLFLDSRLSANGAHPEFPALAPRKQSFDEQSKGFLPWMDPPEHTTYRRMVINEFTVRRIAAMRPRIQEIVDDRISAMLAGPRPVDLVQALALPVPSLTICDLLGVPPEDLDHIQRHAMIMVSRTHTAPERAAALGELRTYLGDLLLAKGKAPQTDMLSRLVVKHRAEGRDDHGHLTGLALLILVGGYESTASTIALGTVALLEHPDQIDDMLVDPALRPRAVEELLRFFSVADNVTSRIAVADIEIGGVTIRAGEGVLLSNAAANRDPSVFAHPEQLDIHQDTRTHVAFGYGIHQCLGQNLARLELEIVFPTLFGRIPGLRLAAPLDELPFKNDAIMFGIHEVPVTW